MKLLLVSINFSIVIVQLGKVIQEIQLKGINTIVCTVTLPAGSLVPSPLEPDASMIILLRT